MTDTRNIHLGRKLDSAVLDLIADVVCGDEVERFPKYRSSYFLTKFFKDAGINIEHDGTSRKRWVYALLERLTPSQTEKVLMRLADRREYQGDIEKLKKVIKELNVALAIDGFKVTYDNNLPVIRFADPFIIDDNTVNEPIYVDEDDFLRKQFSDDIDISELGLDSIVTEYLQSRVNEVQSSPRQKVHLGTIFLLGSTLEGILLGVAIKDSHKFLLAESAPKDGKTGKVRKISDWRLNDLINVSTELGLLSLDVKNFSHTLREFRNYIHPYEQMSKGFKPDSHTVDICWHVFKAAFSQLKENRKSL
jgi:hypothetical protein